MQSLSSAAFVGSKLEVPFNMNMYLGVHTYRELLLVYLFVDLVRACAMGKFFKFVNFVIFQRDNHCDKQLS